MLLQQWNPDADAKTTNLKGAGPVDARRKARVHAPQDAVDEPDRAGRRARHDLPAGTEIREGTNRISVSRLQQIAHTLRVPISFLFDDPIESKAGAHSPGYVSEFLTTTDGLALAAAFKLIKDARLGRSIVKLVEDIDGKNE